jgi:hypothetical protein
MGRFRQDVWSVTNTTPKKIQATKIAAYHQHHTFNNMTDT